MLFLAALAVRLDFDLIPACLSRRLGGSIGFRSCSILIIVVVWRLI
jgi:hypothetical protein